MVLSKRERVRQALAHRQPDSVPWQIDMTSEVVAALVKHTGDEAFEARMGNHLARHEDDYAVEIEPGFWRDQFGVIWNRTVDADIGVVDHLQLVDPELSSYRFPAPNLARNTAAYQQMALAYPDRFRYVWIGWGLFERSWTLRGMENLMTDMVLHPAFVDDLMDGVLAYQLQVIDHAAQSDLDGIGFGDDWSDQRGLMMGSRLWRRFIKPRLKVLFERVREADKVVLLHSCGAMQEVFPDLIDMGLDVFNTLQPEVMDVDWCKQEYGRDLSFYGGISTQQVLPWASPSEVEHTVRRMMARLGQGGGYIVAPTHDIPRDVPAENVLAFVRAVQAQ